MFGDRSMSFPATGLAVVVLFLTTAFLGPRAFESLRQADSDTGKRAHLLEPTVEARLWEDPLVALLRHREKLKGICPDSSEKDKKAEEKADCSDGKPQTADQFKKGIGPAERLTLIVALLPGATLIGGEETRRRQRYALLAGLNAAGYAPDNSERLGLVVLSRCFDFGGCAEGKSDLEIPFETLSADTGKPDERRRVAVLWVDDSKIGRRWLSAVTVLLRKVNPGPGTRLRVVGPGNSDRLVDAIDDLSRLVQESEKSSLLRWQLYRWFSFRRNWDTLAKLHVISPNSTAPAGQLTESFPPPPGVQSLRGLEGLNEVFLAYLRALQGHIGSAEAVQPTFFVSTIGTDDRLIEKLVKELCSRALDPRANGRSHRVILLAEWDSIYARTFGRALKEKLNATACEGTSTTVNLESYQYFRGLDGLTLDGSPAPVRRTSDAARNEKDRQAPLIEWAEGRDQRDYLRRLLELRIGSNHSVSGTDAVQAIGIIGVDVPDKLIMAQAVRNAFPDRVVFTTDIDARLLHPDVLQYTRNMIVASSLPLVLSKYLQCGTAPFRDGYQSAMFLAARYAATPIDGEHARLEPKPNCDEVGDRKIHELVAGELAHARLFEISRDGAVELTDRGSGKSGRAGTEEARKAEKEEARKRLVSAVVGGVALLLLGILMTFVAPGPAMKASWPWWLHGTMSEAATAEGAMSGDAQMALPPERPRETFMLVTALQAAALGFASGVLIELAFPGSAELPGAILGAVLAVMIVGCAYLLREFRVEGTDITATHAILRRLILFSALVASLVAVVVIWAGWLSSGHSGNDFREPFAFANGISSWPSQLLRTLSIVLFAWFLDYALCRSASEADDIGWRYFSQSPVLPGVTFNRRNIVRAFLWRGQPKSGATIAISGARLWKSYRLRLRSWQRFVRVGAGLLVAGGFIWAARVLLGGAWPDIPARGIADRQLFHVTSWIAGVLMIFMMVLVADVTVLTWRFITLLKEGRTFYPPSTVRRFAAELGDDVHLRMQAKKPISARLTRRADEPGNNSLLDDWIDARLLAQHTAVIGRLIVFPFILLSLIIVARSRFFDNWEVGGFVLVIFAFFVFWAVVMAIVLNHVADVARKLAVERMERDRLWLQGAGNNYKELAAQFPGLIDQVRSLRQGAFAPFFEQPLVQAILVPLGGAGGIQLLDLVMQGRL